jgi:bifunctional non-homologous end joining protein LigD
LPSARGAHPVRDKERVTATVAGRLISLGNLDKVLWPDEGYTKGDLIGYYVSVAPYILPHLAGRPLTLTRYPDGITGKCFYQKDIPRNAPAWVQTTRVKHGDHTVDYCLADGPATLAWLGQWACLELHPWLSRTDAPDLPDFAVFDLDPSPPAGFGETVDLAFALRLMLSQFGLRLYPKTSGSAGLHLYLPIIRGYTHKEVQMFVGRTADVISRSLPDLTTRERRVNRRAGVYIDHLQNAKGRTLVSVYSPRPQSGAPVSTPVTWDELPHLSPKGFNLQTIPARLAKLGDLFSAVLTDLQNPGPMMASLGLLGDQTDPAKKPGGERPPNRQA